MEKHDPRACEALFDSEAAQASPSETARWVDLYDRLTTLLQRQLDATREFTARVPPSMRRYLSREDVPILAEELEAAKGRLARWRAMAAAEDAQGTDVSS